MFVLSNYSNLLSYYLFESAIWFVVIPFELKAWIFAYPTFVTLLNVTRINLWPPAIMSASLESWWQIVFINDPYTRYRKCYILSCNVSSDFTTRPTPTFPLSLPSRWWTLCLRPASCGEFETPVPYTCNVPVPLTNENRLAKRYAFELHSFYLKINLWPHN